MNAQELRVTAKILVADHKGLLALDASTPTCANDLPGWAKVFSFARAIQQPAMEIWHGDEVYTAAMERT